MIGVAEPTFIGAPTFAFIGAPTFAFIGAPTFAFIGAAVGACAAVDLAGTFAPRLPSAGGGIRAAAATFTRAASEGRDPEAAERRRLLAGCSLAAFFVAS